MIKIYSTILFLLIRFFGVTWKFTIINEDLVNISPCIFAIWHGHLLPLTYAFRNRSKHVIISRSKDGEIIAQFASKLGYKPIRGSSSRGGAIAALEALTLLKDDAAGVVITVDGPKGPAHVVKDGIALLAKKTQVTVVCAVIDSYSRCKILKSWDSFLIPLPFARISITLKTLGTFNSELPVENIREQIQSAMLNK